MDVGRLNQKVVLLTPSYASSTQSAQGVASFSTLDIAWASVTPVGVDESLSAGSVQSLGRYEIKMRYRADVTPKMRVQWTPYSGSTKTLEVIGVRQQSRDTGYILLLCEVRE